ncbi:MAG: hypothetical protein HY076_05525 [Candidatus Eisenbacteria bacterium]|uniref:FlgD Ig-like domain-containing protein n=1 Tax=Eiseniibacteriota bacterium TaxID=2212470 RepID=A0A9D6LBM5_UNCEI|nr:hypothetical protein [Candidatus Eisenbacteria bacterium]MBI3539714.1 hypothetical protein [Candidatus Eisenbacteria bacterium]
MDALAIMRRAAIGLIASTLALLLVAFAAHASEIGVSGRAVRFTIHGAEETLRNYCVTQDGALWLVLPGGARFELITSTADPAITNPGDGSFHPFDDVEVRAALTAVRYPLDGVCADVFLLPYPRRDGLQSVAGPELILLSPGVLPVLPERQHAEFVHELGHVVQYARMPDADAGAWSRYRTLRGIENTAVYCESGIHADRPHEIFAEDFRALFGDALANYSGTIENSAIAPPATVQGLGDFMRDLAAGAPLATALACYPNPSNGPVRFARGGAAAPAALDLFDVSGRRIATLAPTMSPSGATWTWDGRDARGVPAAAGAFFARARDGGAALRVTRVR